ncbi:protein TonB [Candidatus Odyssella thessalonicensis]|uniref:protein TonB n=1 Tax=Candidatus Odyssella thessalonicensis TaxID=84647 RepID=UPI000225B1C1|nr:protein TonB [Candidatus Odyssella thessalonicensis]
MKDKPKPKTDEAKEKKKIDTEFDNLFSEVVKETKKKDSAKSSGRTKGAPAEQVGEVVTASEIDAIRRLMQRCWIVPNGVRGVRNLQVKLKLNIAKDGTVERAQIVDRGRMAADPVFRAAAESAERAIMDPSCNPLPLNPAKHQQWKTMTMTFDPADMQ